MHDSVPHTPFSFSRALVDIRKYRLPCGRCHDPKGVLCTQTLLQLLCYALIMPMAAQSLLSEHGIYCKERYTYQYIRQARCGRLEDQERRERRWSNSTIVISFRREEMNG